MNHPFWGTPNLGNPYLLVCSSIRKIGGIFRKWRDDVVATVAQCDWHPQTEIIIWLVVWLPWILFFPYIGNNHPNWLSYFSEGWPNHQPVLLHVFSNLTPAFRRPDAAVMQPIFRWRKRGSHSICDGFCAPISTGLVPSSGVLVEEWARDVTTWFGWVAFKTPVDWWWCRGILSNIAGNCMKLGNCPYQDSRPGDIQIKRQHLGTTCGVLKTAHDKP